MKAQLGGNKMSHLFKLTPCFCYDTRTARASRGFFPIEIIFRQGTGLLNKCWGGRCGAPHWLLLAPPFDHAIGSIKTPMWGEKHLNTKCNFQTSASSSIADIIWINAGRLMQDNCWNICLDVNCCQTGVSFVPDETYYSFWLSEGDWWTEMIKKFKGNGQT